MTDREMKRLRRSELLELLLAQMKENQELRERVSELEAQLQDRRIAIERAGSIAEAAMALNAVFEAAQAAADQYLENIQQLSQESQEGTTE